MKILELNFEKTWRGGERQTWLNCKGFIDQGNEVTLICKQGFPLEEKVKVLGLTTIAFTNIFQILWFLIRKGHLFDIIHVQTSHLLTYCVLSKPFHRRPIVFSRRVDFIPKGFFTRLKYKSVDRIVAVSKTVREIVEKSTGKRSTVIYDTLMEYQPKADIAQNYIKAHGWENKKIIATTSAFVDHKDPVTLIHAVAELAQLRNDFVFLHFGSGDMFDECQNLVKELGIESIYQFCGFISEVENMFAVMNVFVMSSKEEGLGSSVLDAFYNRVPVASTNAGGLKEIVTNNRGLVSNIRDSKSLARNINTLLSDSSLQKIVTDNAYDYVTNDHSLVYTSDQYLKVFMELTSPETKKIERVPSIMIDLGKLKNLYCGLGQVSLNYGTTLSNSRLYHQYRLHYLVPFSFINFFGRHIKYIMLTLLKRFIPAVNPTYDIWHAIHQDSSYLPGNKQTKYLLTIHDLNFLYEKKSHQINSRLMSLQKKVNRADIICAISQFTASEINKHLKIGEKPIHIIYNGVVDSSKQAQKKPSFISGKPFFFTIAAVAAKKNFHTLLELAQSLPDYQFIIAGKKSSFYAKRMEKKIKNEKINNVVLPGIITNEEKNWLYANCEAFLFPSKLEGFGLPVIEAMHYGKPVFLSTYTCLPEIGGDMAFYFKSFEKNDMKDIVLNGIKTFRERPNAAALIKAHASQFTWENNLQAYEQLYQQLLSGDFEPKSVKAVA